MNYLKVYNQLIQKRILIPLIKTQLGGVEIHHIIPKSMGGGNYKSNLIHLTTREHFIAHRLLAKIYPNSGMVHAIFKMACILRADDTICISSRTYEVLRINHAIRISGNEETHRRMSESKLGVKQTEEHAKSRALSRKSNGKPWHSEDTSKKISEANRGKVSPFKGVPSDKEVHARGVAKRRSEGSYKWSESQREKMMGANPVTCPYCNKTGVPRVMNRWHFNNCKHRGDINATTSDTNR